MDNFCWLEDVWISVKIIEHLHYQKFLRFLLGVKKWVKSENKDIKNVKLKLLMIINIFGEIEEIWK